MRRTVYEPDGRRNSNEYDAYPVLQKWLVFTIDRFFHIQKGVFMNLYKYKGKRIRASDKNLVYRFCAGTLLFLFIAVLLLLNMGQLMRTDWEHFSLLDNGVTLSTYNFITIGIATGVCALVAFLYYRFLEDFSRYVFGVPYAVMQEALTREDVMKHGRNACAD